MNFENLSTGHISFIATLDEEEMLEGGEDYEEELKILEDDANLPVEELRRRYYGSEEDKVNLQLGDEAQSSSGQEVSDCSSAAFETREGCDIIHEIISDKQ